MRWSWGTAIVTVLIYWGVQHFTGFGSTGRGSAAG